MSKNSIETGVQRLYYAVWVVFVVALTLGVPIDWSRIGVVEVLAWSITAILLPYLFMKIIQWVYRGFFPGKNSL